MTDFSNDFVNREIARLVCGARLGGGAHREVYLHRQDTTLVVKVEERGKSFSNIQEWENWQKLQHVAAMAKWLAPCTDISSCGSVLIQRRVTPVISEEQLPKKIPAMFLDTKIENWGILNGQPVCCDYAALDFNWKQQLKGANWWTWQE